MLRDEAMGGGGAGAWAVFGLLEENLSRNQVVQGGPPGNWTLRSTTLSSILPVRFILENPDASTLPTVLSAAVADGASTVGA